MLNFDKKFPIKRLAPSQFPALLKEINDPPKTLYIRGELPSEEAKYLCVVGSRAHTSYGEDVCEKLISGLAGHSIIVVSGLALGIDAIAHRTALDVGLKSIAIPGSGLGMDVLYPSINKKLAERILENGGAIISEQKSDFRATPYSFPQRNRIMAGMSHAVLVIEAELRSGTLITSKYATDYNRDVCTVPGSIFSRKSDGPHMLIRLGATPVRNSDDILEVLGLARSDDVEVQNKLRESRHAQCSEEEHSVLEILKQESRSRDEIIRLMGKPASETNALLVMMEIKELVVERGGEMYVF